MWNQVNLRSNLKKELKSKLICFFFSWDIAVSVKQKKENQRKRKCLISCPFHQHSTDSFYAGRSQKSKKIQLSHQYLITLSGSASVKAVRRTLMKLSPGFMTVVVTSYCSVSKVCQTNWKSMRQVISQFNLALASVAMSNIMWQGPLKV